MNIDIARHAKAYELAGMYFFVPEKLAQKKRVWIDMNGYKWKYLKYAQNAENQRPNALFAKY